MINWDLRIPFTFYKRYYDNKSKTDKGETTMRWIRRKMQNVIEAIEDSGTTVKDIKTIFWETNKLMWSIAAMWILLYLITK